MTNNERSQKDQDKIVEQLISGLDETGTEDDFNENLYNQLDVDHQMQVDTAIREFADHAVGDEHWDSDE
ncbi:hypothetical protein ACLIBH_11670 [Virgibacillus sp. W0430]|uniref:hypothetical protein n=1 Tax=Virgibacillus sp. W0430 TaxID=3391580 RepID=UPI003F454327